eukprot:NODE_6012_length_537_cov_31.405738_g5262_i0.p2 GENE.NODE_6012_length_537_cov_31.405738_g5262_i0~~NODE_6012_length_537_cov_31.405738_g5262_i0.p2  ORF type:complete len:117 (-),score=21.36 NODE_6012_length_537_cov_31.405738_g5262_i0:28-378(-)
MIVVMPTKFAFFFTCGNVFLLASTCFLVGPLRQAQNMFDPTRISASVVYLISLPLTLFSALKFGSLMMVVAFVTLQLVAMLWYLLSYIPFARTIAKTTLGKLGQSCAWICGRCCRK